VADGDGETGELQSVDGYMNIALEGVQEIVKGRPRREYGDAFVRGNNGEGSLPFSSFLFCFFLAGLLLARALAGVQRSHVDGICGGRGQFTFWFIGLADLGMVMSQSCTFVREMKRFRDPSWG
jgi:hypothetical protein